MVDSKMTVQDVGLVVAVVPFTSVNLEAVLALNGALDLLEAGGRGGA